MNSIVGIDCKMLTLKVNYKVHKNTQSQLQSA